MKKILIPIGIIISLLLCVYPGKVKVEQPPAIEEIPNTHIKSVVNNTDYRYFVVSNPPEDLYELKTPVENYTEKFINDNDITGVDDETIFFDWRFFRETKVINTDWKQSEGYFSVDRIEDHFNDIIAAASWYSKDTEKRYIVRSLSSKSDFGNIVEASREIN